MPVRDFVVHAIYQTRNQEGEQVFHLDVPESAGAGSATATTTLPRDIWDEINRLPVRSAGLVLGGRALPVAGVDGILTRLAEAERTRPRDVGTRLFEFLMPDDIYAQYVKALEAARAEESDLRIRLKVPSALQTVPWEFLFDSRGEKEFLTRSKGVSLTRYSDVSGPMRPPLQGRPRVLGLSADPTGTLNLDCEKDRIKAALEKSSITIDWAGKTRKHLRDALENRGPWDVFHFMGHGDFDAEKGGLLLLEREDGSEDLVEASELARLFKNQDYRIGTAVINACKGATGSQVAKDYSGTAQALLAQGCTSVVAMQYVIGDSPAVAFAERFYSELATGSSVDVAVRKGRDAIEDEEASNLTEWGTPVLHSRLELPPPVPPLPKQVGPLLFFFFWYLLAEMVADMAFSGWLETAVAASPLVVAPVAGVLTGIWVKGPPWWMVSAIGGAVGFAAPMVAAFFDRFARTGADGLFGAKLGWALLLGGLIAVGPLMVKSPLGRRWLGQ